jgi:hypothetical protein
MGVGIQDRPCDTEINPPGTDPRRPILRTERFWTWALLFLVVTGILFFRQPSAIRHPAFSDEDGLIYFKQAYEQGAFSVILLPYNGYLQIIPRTVAAFGNLLPLQLVPRFYAGASLLLAAMVFTFFYAANFRRVIASDATRAGVIVLFTLMPNSDSLMRVAYLPWYALLFIVFVVLMELPGGSWQRGVLFGALTLAIWSTPVVIVCLPIILFRLWRAADRRDRIWWTAVAISVVAYALTADRTVIWNFWRPGLIQSVVHAIGYRVFCFFFLGSELTRPLLESGWEIITRLSLMLAGGCVFAAVSLTRQSAPRSEATTRAGWIVLYLIFALPVLFVLRPQWIPNFLSTSAEAWTWHSRYFFCSTLLLCVFAGMVYEAVRSWLFNDRARLFVSGILLVFWISLHLPGFKLQQWQVKPAWKQTAGEIHAAEVRVNQTGQREVIRIPNATAIWAFDLIIAKKN